MKKHVLLENAYRYDAPQEINAPEGCTYDHDSGYWADEMTGKPMMEGKDPKPQATKKCDRETGEDQKGE